VDPHEYCRQKAAASGSSLYYSLLLVPADRRAAVTALHAFAREIRDGLDEVRDPGVARTKLAWWQEEVGRLYEGKPRHPVTRALADAVTAYGIERNGLEEILLGAAMDLEYNAYPDFDALTMYCRRVGGAVSLLAAKIFGYRNPQTTQYAEALGVALELTRIIRDVGEDARHGRVYLPLHEMAEYGVPSDDLAHARETDNLRRLVAFQIRRANEYYERAIGLVPPIDRRPQRPGLALAAIQRALLREIEDDGCHVLTRRTSLTPLRKLWIAFRTK
jgi:phytoene synthase